jgi:SnoaL-like domain
VSEATIHALYAALDRHDGEGAAACYTDDAVFEDPAFGRLEGGTVKDARSTFRDGLIAEQVDAFPLRRWGAQALGAKGAVLGLTPLLSRGVQKQARSSLDRYTGA